jgi:hypothetical protein
MSYEKFLGSVDWHRPLDRGRTPSENRAAIAKVDQLVADTDCTKTHAFCQIELNFNTYYKIKRADGVTPTPHSLVHKVRAANNPGGPGRAAGYKYKPPKKKAKARDKFFCNPVDEIQSRLTTLQSQIERLRDLGVDLRVTVGG